MDMSVILDLQREHEAVEGLLDQSVFNFRAKSRAVLLAGHLLDEEGNFRHLNETIKAIGYVLGPRSYNDGDITQSFFTGPPCTAFKPSSGPKSKEFWVAVIRPQTQRNDRHHVGC